MPAASAPGIHPRDLPHPLRRALIGTRARDRLDRLLVIAGHSSIPSAAQALGLWQLCQQARDYLGIQPESGTP